MRVLSTASRALLAGMLCAWPVNGAVPCERLARRAQALYEARADYVEVVQAARLARACAGRLASASLYAAEAWGLVNDERWDELIALGRAFDAHRRGLPVPLDDLARVEANVGVALVVRGQASEGLGRQHALLARLPITRPLLRASALSSLAWSYGLLGDYAEAERRYRQMQAVVVGHLYGPARRPMHLRALSERAGNLLAWHENETLPKPTTRLRLAHTLAREAYWLAQAEEDEASMAIARLFEGEALHYLGDLAEATAALQHVEALPDPTYWPYARWDRARLAARRGRTAEAERLYRQALSALEADAGDARDLLYELGALYEQTGRPAAAEATYRASLAALDRLLATAGADDSWLRVQNVWQRPYRGLCRVLATQGRVREALEVLGGAQARFLQLYRARAGSLAASKGGEMAALLAAQEALRDRLAAVRTDAERLRLMAREDSLRARMAALTTLPRPAPLDLQVLQRTLATRGQVLVSMLLDTPEPFLRRDLASFAFVVTADTVAAVPLTGHAPDVARLVHATSPVLTQDRAGLAGRAFDLGALHTLYQTVLAPTRRFWGQARRLVVIPDGPLFSVPLAALVVRGGVRPQYLGEDVATSVELSPALLMAPAAIPGSAGRVVVAGRSRFGRAEAAPLPHVRREAAAVRKRAGHVEVLLDAKATETRVRAAAARAQVLHLATHTDLSAPSPLYYAFRLLPDAREDGLLRLHEIQAQRLPLALVVLSGCATARGILHAGEGMAGLQYGFRAAGAQSVVATLWLVDDAAMGTLMADFYRELQHGRPADLALMEAQRRYRARHPRATPFAWAAPVLYGSAATVRLRAVPWYRADAVRFGGIGALLLAVVSALGVALYHRHRQK